MNTHFVKPVHAARERNARRAARMASRRGSGVIVVVLVLAAMQLVMLGSVTSSGDESAVSSLRVDGIRAFFAGESGAIVASKTVMASLTPPAADSTLAIGSAQVKFVTVPDPTLGGTLTLDGTSGEVTRRIRVTLADPSSP